MTCTVKNINHYMFNCTNSHYQSIQRKIKSSDIQLQSVIRIHKLNSGFIHGISIKCVTYNKVYYVYV
jgi:hypothetical protein